MKINMDLVNIDINKIKTTMDNYYLQGANPAYASGLTFDKLISDRYPNGYYIINGNPSDSPIPTGGGNYTWFVWHFHYNSPTNAYKYAVQFATGQMGQGLWFRKMQGGVWYSWHTLYAN